MMHNRQKKNLKPFFDFMELRLTPSSTSNFFYSGGSVQFIINYKQKRVYANESTLGNRIGEGKTKTTPPGLKASPSPLNSSNTSGLETGSSNPTIYRNIVYLNDGQRKEKLDVYLPSTPAPTGGYPVVLSIHGGGWYRNSKEHFIPAVLPMTNSGFAVVAVNYELSTARKPSWPVALSDLWQAQGWINRQSVTYQLNPQKIAAIGTSAGGNLAMMLATGFQPSNPSTGRQLQGNPISNQKLPKINAAVSFFGPTELASCANESRKGAGRAIARFLGGSSIDYPQRYKNASPINHVSKTTSPIMMIHGTSDDVIPVNQSEKMADALASAGVFFKLIKVAGGTHSNIGSNLVYMNKSYESEIVSFLRKAMNLD